MIAFLRGRLAARGTDWVEVDVGGIGFRAAISALTAGRLPPPGAEVVLQTVMVVRDDGVSLFGFADEDERRAFRALSGVGGVGGRTALAVLSMLAPAALAAAVEAADESRLTAVPGVGRKTAQRILLELRGRLPVAAGVSPAAAPPPGTPEAEAQAALQGLGYTAEQSRAAVEAVRGAAPDVEGIVRAALRALAGRS